MKQAAAMLLAVVLLAGCRGESREMERAMALRTKLLAAQGCSFETAITADYGEKLHIFTLDCEADQDGNIRFSVIRPDSIQGIAGTVDGADGRLTFQDKALTFPLLADGQITPVCGPWILMKTLRSGYLTSAMAEGDGLRLSIDDSYADDALHLDIWLDPEDLPKRAEILYRERKILSLDVKNFRIQ